MTKKTVGWREWLALPELGIAHIKAKVDTGARTSALHTFDLHTFRKDDQNFVRFSIHPYQDSSEVIVCEHPLFDERWVTDSGGHKEMRPVIETLITVGEESFKAEVTLTNRETMKFRMLLGRTAMRDRLIVDPQASYLLGEEPEK